MQLTCIHSLTPFNEDAALTLEPVTLCGKRAVRIMHGFLCIGHWREQQRAMPERPRKPRYFSFDDAAVIRDILHTDATHIKAGTVRTIWRGGLALKVLEA